jgi:hypothetical protein
MTSTAGLVEALGEAQAGREGVKLALLVGSFGRAWPSQYRPAGSHHPL